MTWHVCSLSVFEPLWRPGQHLGAKSCICASKNSILDFDPYETKEEVFFQSSSSVFLRIFFSLKPRHSLFFMKVINNSLWAIWSCIDIFGTYRSVLPHDVFWIFSLDQLLVGPTSHKTNRREVGRLDWKLVGLTKGWSVGWTLISRTGSPLVQQEASQSKGDLVCWKESWLVALEVGWSIRNSVSLTESSSVEHRWLNSNLVIGLKVGWFNMKTLPWTEWLPVGPRDFQF